MKRAEKYLPLISSLGLLAVSLTAFSRKVRYEILERDNYTCVDCGYQGTAKEFEASHLDHLRSSTYNYPENGVTHCKPCHYLFHLEHKGKAHEIGLSEQDNDWAVESIYGRLTKQEKKRLHPQQLDMFR